MADSSKPPGSDKERAERLAQNARHGGLVILRGGYWDANTLWQDQYDALPALSTKRVGYARTETFEDTTLGYGRARVYRWSAK